MKANNNIIVAFHIGVGGRPLRSGHVKFIGECNFQELMNLGCNIDRLFPQNRDEHGRFCKQYMTDCSGQVMVTADEMKSDTGRLDWDGEYDTDYCQNINDCDYNELFKVVEGTGCYRSYELECWLDEWLNEGLKCGDSEIECFVEEHKTLIDETKWLHINID